MNTNLKTIDRPSLECILQANSQAEALASTGEWESLGRTLAKRDAMLRDIDDGKKEMALVATLKSTEQIRALVEKRRNEIGKELGQLQRGREATESYSANS